LNYNLFQTKRDSCIPSKNGSTISETDPGIDIDEVNSIFSFKLTFNSIFFLNQIRLLIMMMVDIDEEILIY